LISPRQVLDTRRGRCGEYSVLVLHMLQALGYTARWVVDRDDHVSPSSNTATYLSPSL
jgi:transglutaminase-like putative cysteine protease